MNDAPPEETRQLITVTATAVPEYCHLVHVEGLAAGPIWFRVMSRPEGQELVMALCEAFGLYVHMPDGCEDDGCPCIQRRESQERAR